MPSASHSERRRMVVEEVSDTPVVNEPVAKVENVAPQVPGPEPVQMPQVPEVPQQMGDYSNPEVGVQESSNIAWILIPGIMLLGALLGGIIFYQNKVAAPIAETPVPMATTEAVETVAPTATPVSENVDLEKYTIVLQNGSGIKGEAAKAKDILEKAGFKVGTTGNANSFNYTNTIIQVTDGIESGYIIKLKEALGAKYVVSKEQTVKSAQSSVTVIIGSTMK